MSATEKILVVVVLYRGTDEASSAQAATVRCLASIFSGQPGLLEQYRVLLWDNSHSRMSGGLPAFPCDYRHAASEGASNDGVSGAYNSALDISIQNGYRWMLLLDQDTEIDGAYLSGMAKQRAAIEDDERIAAIAPLLFEKDFPLSPHWLLRFRAVPVEPGASRVLEEDSFAANSGLLMRASALQAIGGYSLDFWLDYSDIELFHRLYRAGRRIYLAAELRLEHNMTMLDYDGRMTPERYGNFLAAEQAFFDLYRDRVQNAVQLLRLAARVLRQRKYRNPVFSQLTRRFLLQRLSTSRTDRLKTWYQRRPVRQTAAASA